MLCEIYSHKWYHILRPRCEKALTLHCAVSDYAWYDSARLSGDGSISDSRSSDARRHSEAYGLGYQTRRLSEALEHGGRRPSLIQRRLATVFLPGLLCVTNWLVCRSILMPRLLIRVLHSESNFFIFGDEGSIFKQN